MKKIIAFKVAHTCISYMWEYPQGMLLKPITKILFPGMQGVERKQRSHCWISWAIPCMGC